MSSSATLESTPPRCASGRPVGSPSAVGSRIVSGIATLPGCRSAPWLNASALRARARCARDPAADHHREQARVAAGVAEQDPVGSEELRDRRLRIAEPLRREPLGDAAGAAHQLARGTVRAAVQFLLHALARPAGLAEDAPVLG